MSQEALVCDSSSSFGLKCHAVRLRKLFFVQHRGSHPESSRDTSQVDQKLRPGRHSSSMVTQRGFFFECMFYDINNKHTHRNEELFWRHFSFRFPFWIPFAWSSNFGLSVPFTSSPAPKPRKSVASAHRSRVVETKGDRTWWGQWPKMNKAKLSIDHGFRVPHVSRYIFVYSCSLLGIIAFKTQMTKAIRYLTFKMDSRDSCKTLRVDTIEIK